MQFLSVVHLGCLAKLLNFLLCRLLPSPHLLPSFRQAVVMVAVRHVEQAMECGDEVSKQEGFLHASLLLLVCLFIGFAPKTFLAGEVTSWLITARIAFC